MDRFLTLAPAFEDDGMMLHRSPVCLTLEGNLGDEDKEDEEEILIRTWEEYEDDDEVLIGDLMILLKMITLEVVIY